MTPTKLHRRFFPALLLILAACLLPSTAPAAFVFQLSQVGSDVVVTGSGTLNLAALTRVGIVSSGSGLLPATGSIVVDPTGNLVWDYMGLSGPTSWGSGLFSPASSSSGDHVGINSSLLFVDLSYVSGSLLSNSMTFTNMTFSDLGFTPGTYIYTWGSGATADSLTITTVVPEPSTWTLMGLGAVVLFGLMLRSRAARSV